MIRALLTGAAIGGIAARRPYDCAMPRTVEVSVVVPAPIEDVWADLAQLESHSEWMRDAEAIEFLTDQRAGVGTRIRVPTRVGPLTTVDEMQFTAWEPPHRMAIDHQGKFSGQGEIALQETLEGTVVTWRERVKFPWTFAGPIGEFVAAPILRWIWKKNLEALSERF